MPVSEQFSNFFRGGGASSLLWSAFASAFRMAGWRVALHPAAVQALRSGSVVLLCGPHTSNWDFPIFVGAVAQTPLRPAFLVKASLLRGPLGTLMRALGAVAVNRDQSGGLIGAGTELLRSGASIGLLPKGTRSARAFWKPGAFYLAAGSGRPLLPVVADWRRRTVFFREPKRVESAWLLPEGAAELTVLMDALRQCFADGVGHGGQQDVVRLELEVSQGPR